MGEYPRLSAQLRGGFMLLRALAGLSRVDLARNFERPWTLSGERARNVVMMLEEKDLVERLETADRCKDNMGRGLTLLELYQPRIMDFLAVLGVTGNDARNYLGGIECIQPHFSFQTSNLSRCARMNRAKKHLKVAGDIRKQLRQARMRRNISEEELTLHLHDPWNLPPEAAIVYLRAIECGPLIECLGDIERSRVAYINLGVQEQRLADLLAAYGMTKKASKVFEEIGSVQPLFALRSSEVKKLRVLKDDPEGRKERASDMLDQIVPASASVNPYRILTGRKDINPGVVDPEDAESIRQELQDIISVTEQAKDLHRYLAEYWSIKPEGVNTYFRWLLRNPGYLSRPDISVPLAGQRLADILAACGASDRAEHLVERIQRFQPRFTLYTSSIPEFNVIQGELDPERRAERISQISGRVREARGDLQYKEIAKYLASFWGVTASQVYSYIHSLESGRQIKRLAKVHMRKVIGNTSMTYLEQNEQRLADIFAAYGVRIAEVLEGIHDIQPRFAFRTSCVPIYGTDTLVTAHEEEKKKEQVIEEQIVALEKQEELGELTEEQLTEIADSIRGRMRAARMSRGISIDALAKYLSPRWFPRAHPGNTTNRVMYASSYLSQLEEGTAIRSFFGKNPETQSHKRKIALHEGRISDILSALDLSSKSPIILEGIQQINPFRLLKSDVARYVGNGSTAPPQPEGWPIEADLLTP